MIQYVEKLFQESKTIILPGLGALTITNPDTKELMFMPFLKHDDGALAGFIEKEAGISEEEAKKMVSDEVHSMLNEIESGQSVSFGGFGSFSKGEDGDIEFVNAGGEGSKNDPIAETEASENSEAQEKAAAAEALKAKEEEAAKVKAQEEKAKKAAEAAAKAKAVEAEKAKKEAEAKAKAQEEKAKKEAETAAKEKALKDAQTEKKADEQQIAEEPTAKTTSPKPARATVNQVIPESSKAEDATSGKNILEKEEIAANQKKLDDLRSKKEHPKKKKKRGAGFYILLVLLILIISGGTFVVLNYETAKEYLPFLKEEKAVASKGDEEMDKMEELVGSDETTNNDAQEVTDVSEDSTNVAIEEPTTEPETTPEPTPEPEPKPTPTPTVTGSNNLPFHIVAGVFSEASNANRLVEKLKGMGYPAKTIQRGAQNVVSVKSYATAAEAQAALSTVTDAAPKGWVLEWR